MNLEDSWGPCEYPLPMECGSIIRYLNWKSDPTTGHSGIIFEEIVRCPAGSGDS